MSYWLFKTEPSCYSYDELEKDKKTCWDGVANNLALKYLRQVKKGDLAIIYHTGDERSAIGIAEVTSEPYVDPKESDAKLAVVDVKPKKRLAKAVSLAEIKANPAFADFLLVKMSRLSVMPVTDKQWKMIVGK
ncbi:MAG: EVE domain-containing protein [Candidatus Obscuribacterales bacterium]|nr:EVE domain-containing protein [Candidatus Obscuribacterales bacterium]